MSAVDSQATAVPFSFGNGSVLGPWEMMRAGAGPTLSWRHCVAGCAGLPVTFTLQTKTFVTRAGLGNPSLVVAVDSNVTVAPSLVADGCVLSPSEPNVICRISMVRRFSMKIWRREDEGRPRQTVSVGRQMNEPRASKATQTSLTSWPEAAVPMLGLAGFPVIVFVTWRRKGVPGGGQGVRWQPVVWSVPQVSFVVPWAQS